MNYLRIFWLVSILVVFCVSLGVGVSCGDDDDDADDDVTDDDAADDDAADDDASDDDAADDDAADDDAADDDAADDDAADDDAADDDAADDDVADDDVTDDDATDDDATDDDITSEEQLISNGGFETGSIEPWVGDWGGGIVYGSDEITTHDGVYAVWLGGRKDVIEWIGQVVTVPAGLGEAQLRFWNNAFRIGTPETGGLTVRLRDSLNRETLAVLYEQPLEEYVMIGRWEEVVVDLTADQMAAVTGQQVVVHFEIQSYGGGWLANLNNYIDDVTFTCWW